MSISATKFFTASATALTVAIFAFSANAQDAKPVAKPKTACNSMKEQAACEARTDCGWVSESKDEKTGKVKKKAYCRAKPAAKKG